MIASHRRHRHRPLFLVVQIVTPKSFDRQSVGVGLVHTDVEDNQEEEEQRDNDDDDDSVVGVVVDRLQSKHQRCTAMFLAILILIQILNLIDDKCSVMMVVVESRERLPPHE